MKVVNIWTNSTDIPERGLDVLTQHGMDNIMAAPNTWSKKVDKHYGLKVRLYINFSPSSREVLALPVQIIIGTVRVWQSPF